MSYKEAWTIFLSAVIALGAIGGIVAIIALGIMVSGWFFIALVPAIPTAMWIVAGVLDD